MHMLLAFVRKVIKSNRKVYGILKIFNMTLGPLKYSIYTNPKDIFHLNISAKWTLMEYYSIYSDCDSIYDVDINIGILLNLLQLSEEKLKSFIHPEKIISSTTPFPCPCIKSLWLYMIGNLEQIVVWNNSGHRFGRLIHGSETVAKDVLEFVVFEKHLSNTWDKTEQP